MSSAKKGSKKIKIKSTFELEKKLSEKFQFMVGFDEVGRGPLAGPVVAGAAVLKDSKLFLEQVDDISSTSLDSNFLQQKNQRENERFKPEKLNQQDIPEQSEQLDSTALRDYGASNQNLKDEQWDLVRDSKMLSEKQREKAFDFVLENFYVGIGICNPETIDRINILQASFLAMKKAFTDLKNKMPELKQSEDKIILLIDGNQYIPNLTIEQKCILQGDKKVKSISAASIVAKVTRDKMMIEYAKKYPEYGFEKHKGYGTKIHMEALQKFGATDIHRKSFAPVKRVLGLG